jgi:trans-aconitate methyltransferase
MIEAARARGIDARVADGEELAFDAEFDAVFSNAALHWMRRADAVLSGVGRALKPGGRFVAEFGGAGNVAQISAALRQALREAANVDFDAIDPWYFPSIAEYAGLLERQGFKVTFAQLFPRPTSLEGGEQGMRNWIKMFGASLLDHVRAERKDAVFAAAENHVRGTLFRDGQWSADYVRLRVVAQRPES